MNLPIDFLNSMQSLRCDEYDDFIKSYDDKPHFGLRVNTNKISVEEFIKIAPYEIKKIPFIGNGFFINEGDAWSKHPYYFAGLYYLQEPSAMLPADRLPVSETDKVLDLCAAPGGKSTALSNKTDCLLIANDISFSRTIPLVKNLELFGAKNFYVINENPDDLKLCFREFFDKILIDAPCSGEGMFRKDTGLIKAYEKKGPDAYSDIQKSITEAAYDMLMPGGMIMYSTCTFSPKEDEEVIYSLLKNHDDLKLMKVDEYSGFSYCYADYKDADISLDECVHIFPDKMDGEGHFLALIYKDSCDKQKCDAVLSRKKSNLVRLTKSEKTIQFYDFIDKCKIDFGDFYINEKGMIFSLPRDYEAIAFSGIHFTRTGNFIGTLNSKNKTFIPYTGLALLLRASKYDNCICFNADDSDVIKYLKGETIVIDDAEYVHLKDDLVLICVDDYGLGFGKLSNGKIKNLYEKGWRMN